MQWQHGVCANVVSGVESDWRSVRLRPVRGELACTTVQPSGTYVVLACAVPVRGAGAVGATIR